MDAKLRRLKPYPQMKKTLLFAIIALLCYSANAQTKKDGTPDMRYSANKAAYSAPVQTYSAPSTSSYSAPVYSGSTHTESHEGTYVGQQDPKTHKGGRYVNPVTGRNQYGKHKKVQY